MPKAVEIINNTRNNTPLVEHQNLIGSTIAGVLVLSLIGSPLRLIKSNTIYNITNMAFLSAEGITVTWGISDKDLNFIGFGLGAIVGTGATFILNSRTRIK